MNSRLKKYILCMAPVICATIVFAAIFRAYGLSEAINLYTEGGQPPVLLYHHFVEESSEITEDLLGVTVTAGKFESDIQKLLGAGYIPISTAEYFKQCRSDGAPLPEKPIIIQFDDGYESNYIVAYPIFKKYKVPIDIFLVTEFVGRKSDPRLTFLTWEQIGEMRESGLVEIYSHGTDHTPSGSLPVMKLRQMILESEETLDRHIEGRPLRIFAFPTGDTSDRAMQTIREVGIDAQMLLGWGVSRSSRNINFLLRLSVREEDDPLEVIDRLEERVEYYKERPY